MNILLTELLNLPGVIVEDWQQTETELILSVEINADYATCPRGGEVSKHLHANTGYWLRDLPLSNREVWLKVNRRRFKCFKCEKPFIEDLFFVGRRKKYTHRYATKYFEQKTTNGFVEGIKNKLKLLKRSGFNFRNFDNFELRA